MTDHITIQYLNPQHINFNANEADSSWKSVFQFAAQLPSVGLH